MLVDFYSLIQEEVDRSADLRTNLVTLLDKLLKDPTMPSGVASKLAQLRAKIEIDLSNLS